MTTRKLLIVALGTLLSTAATSSVLAMPSPAKSNNACVFSAYDARAVAPFNGEENYGLGNYTELKGAQVFVPAREGLTEQWLTRVVQTAFSTKATSSCQPTVKDLQVHVVSAGTGFWVQLIAANPEQGKKVLDWARGLVASQGLR